MKILAVGRNYKKHTQELGNQLPTEPIIFLMPETTLVRNNKPFFYPSFSKDIHYEVELVLRISKLGKSISEKFAHRYYNEIGIGIDFTARDIQTKLQKDGLPWEISKSFDGASPLGQFVPKDRFENILDINFSLEKNDEVVQKGNTKDMIFSFDSIISYVSKFFTLKIGDLIFTGTPAGVGSIAIGDTLIAKIEGEELLKTAIK
jgi:2-keto-4-pentenoate hydratase/2-oxohepta-3-ene-1,7-dioic acid hydratase in catechol pathway